MQELHVKSLLPVRLDKYLMEQFPALGLGRLNKALRENKIKLNGKKQPLATRVQNGDVIRVYLLDDQLGLTGLDVQENQARRLLNDLDAYRTSTWRDGEDLEIVATDWMREVFEPTVRMIPREYRSQIEPAQFFHEVLDHRWFLAEKAGHDVTMTEAD